jgi:hypothetical protein
VSAPVLLVPSFLNKPCRAGCVGRFLDTGLVCYGEPQNSHYAPQKGSPIPKIVRGLPNPIFVLADELVRRANWVFVGASRNGSCIEALDRLSTPFVFWPANTSSVCLWRTCFYSRSDDTQTSRF